MEIVLDVLSDVFNKPAEYFSQQQSFKEIEGWDSFTHINLITSLEEKLAVNFTEDEIVAMVTIQDLYNVLGSKRSN